MRPGSRGHPTLLSLGLGLSLAACSAGATPSAVPSGSSATCGPTTSACPMPTSLVSPGPASPSTSAAPSSTLAPSASPAGSTPAPSACPSLPATLDLSSDRLVGIDVVAGDTSDLVRFRLGSPTWTGGGPAIRPTAQVAPASPPYLADPSGLPLDVTGERVVRVRMEGMWLYDDAGVPTYGGPARFDEPGPGVRSIVLAEAFEGYESWLIGFDGPGCLTVGLASTVEGDSIEIRIGHAPRCCPGPGPSS